MTAASVTASAAGVTLDMCNGARTVDKQILGIYQPDTVFNDVRICMCRKTRPFMLAAHDEHGEAADSSTADCRKRKP